MSNRAGSADDFYFYSGIFDFSAPVEMGVIDEANIPNCSTFSERTTETVNLRYVESGQSLCIRTSEGRWVLARITAASAPPDGVAAGGSVTLRFEFL
ncbi:MULTISPECIES: hypothetical protein [Streptomyces]|uniref:Uncharacterized protein n=1 Tax=Streptomyces sp. R02 TaxID=3238623 RepID=A0AB39LZ24_9ACTN